MFEFRVAEERRIRDGIRETRSSLEGIFHGKECTIIPIELRNEHAICKVFFLRGHGRILRKIIIDYFSEFQKFRVEE